MKTKKSRKQAGRLREFDRMTLRSAFVSLFWVIINVRRKSPEGFTFQGMADDLGIDKSGVSRWFTNKPNWRLSSAADIANHLGVDLMISARDRRTGAIYAPHGMVSPGSTNFRVEFEPPRAEKPSADDLPKPNEPPPPSTVVAAA